MARPTVTIIGTAIWRSPTRSSISNSVRDIKLTNYGEFLAKFPPTQEVEIVENSAWSCAHGIERWRSNCGCNSGGHPGWNQDWRAPLRAALDWLRDKIAPLYERQGRELFKTPGTPGTITSTSSSIGTERTTSWPNLPAASSRRLRRGTL